MVLFVSCPLAQAQLKDFLKKKKDAAAEKVIEKATKTLTDFRETLKELKEAGFVAEEVSMVGALNPKFGVVFVDQGETGKEKEVAERNKDDKIFSSVLKMLVTLRAIKVESYSLKKIKVEFGFPPKVTWVAKVEDL